MAQVTHIKGNPGLFENSKFRAHVTRNLASPSYSAHGEVIALPTKGSMLAAGAVPGMPTAVMSPPLSGEDCVLIPDEFRDHYEFVSRLTSGAEAELFLLRKRESGEEHLVKIYWPGLSPNTQILDWLMSQDTENVARLHAHGKVDGRYYEIWKYYPWRTLRSHMDETKECDQGFCRKLLQQVSDHLQQLHQSCIVHGDVKPENILVSDDDEPRFIMIDYGVSRYQDKQEEQKSQPAFTLAYASPELLRGEIHTASDYWSLGIVLLEIISCRHPFAGLDDDCIKTLIQEEWPERIYGISDAIWNELVTGLLQRKADLRWTYDEVRAWLDNRVDVRCQPIVIGDESCLTIEEFTIALLRHWSIGERLLQQGALESWIKSNYPDICPDPKQYDDSDTTISVRLLHFVYTLNSELPPVWKGISLTQGGMIGLCQEAIDGDETALSLIEDIYFQDVLARIGKLRNDAKQIVDADSWKKAVDDYSSGWDLVAAFNGPVGRKMDLRSRLPLLYLALHNQSIQSVLEQQVNRATTLGHGYIPWCTALRIGDKNQPLGKQLVIQEILPELESLQRRNFRTLPDFSNTEHLNAQNISTWGRRPPQLAMSCSYTPIMFTACGIEFSVGLLVKIRWMTENSILNYMSGVGLVSGNGTTKVIVGSDKQKITLYSIGLRGISICSLSGFPFEEPLLNDYVGLEYDRAAVIGDSAALNSPSKQGVNIASPLNHRVQELGKDITIHAIRKGVVVLESPSKLERRFVDNAKKRMASVRIFQYSDLK